LSLFITFEGSDGAGKSTQVELLRAALSDRLPLVVREPGGTPLGERVREVLLHGGSISAEAEMLLFMAARAELLTELIRPALEAGRIVIADRYQDSTLAYQGGGRGIETWWPTDFPRPDRTFLLRLPSPEAGFERMRGAGKRADRLESAGPQFHRRVAEEYDRLAATDPSRWVVLDAALPPAEVHGGVMTALESLLAPVP
jgi:dTMP kinase